MYGRTYRYKYACMCVCMSAHTSHTHPDALTVGEDEVGVGAVDGGGGVAVPDARREPLGVLVVPQPEPEEGGGHQQEVQGPQTHDGPPDDGVSDVLLARKGGGRVRSGEGLVARGKRRCKRNLIAEGKE